MKRYDKVTPEGTRDLLFDECKRREQIVDLLKGLFTARGYRRVMTPSIEFYDVFGVSAAYLPQETMYKLMDNKGRLMVMCPDCTVPIARLTATRLKNMPLPLRLYYSRNVYRMNNDLRGKSSEIYQAGVELIGSNSLRSDLEMMALAAASLAEISGDEYRLEICHIGYFKALIDSLPADEATKEAIRAQVEQKNYSALNDILEQFGDIPAALALKYLPRLFGGEEVFAEAYRLFADNGAKESLDYLKGIFERLQQLGLGDKVIIDLGLVNQAEYYTGLIFRGYFADLGEPVLSGGRYDKLLPDFGVDLQAIGFAVNVDLATQCLVSAQEVKPDALVMAAEEQYLVKAIHYQENLIAKGLVVENGVWETREEALAYGLERGIAQLHIIGKTTEIIDIEK